MTKKEPKLRCDGFACRLGLQLYTHVLTHKHTQWMGVVEEGGG